MTGLAQLFERNRAWAQRMLAEDPGFFARLAHQQSPEYLWIGCSDSRVPANQITGLAPGEVFVHRNVANVVVPTDLNCLSVVQFAVDLLRVRHVIVCGHYGCGGVLAALEDQRVGLCDNWLQHVKDVRNRHGALLEAQPAEHRHEALCELNVIEQVVNLAHTTVMQDAWSRGQQVTLHGWCYALSDGLLRNLHMSVEGTAQVESAYRAAIEETARVPRPRAS